MSSNDTILTMENITKTFGPVKALTDVNLSVDRGEIHAICGENGAGKSTLMNVLSGVYPYGSYSGKITFDGKECKYHTRPFAVWCGWVCQVVTVLRSSLPQVR